jgi:hypothetical protein
MPLTPRFGAPGHHVRGVQPFAALTWRPGRKHTAGAGLVVVLGLILIALARAQLVPTQDQITAQDP